MGLVHNLLAHPLTRGLSVDDPRTTLLRRQIIRQKALLEAIYREWYGLIVAALPGTERVLELGSGGGFFDELLPEAITSEIFLTPGVALVADACQLPFADASLDAIVMTDVFHHIPNVADFLTEATRCIRPGGKIVMIEPWRTPWAEWVYTHLHSEPFEPGAGWTIPSSGPLSGANGALPWIVFERDRALFEERFPQWRLREPRPLMPVAYLLSGGVSLRSLMPGWAYRPLRFVESLLPQRQTAMFAFIELERLP
jgi:SAM-dependent methyltransferase